MLYDTRSQESLSSQHYNLQDAAFQSAPQYTALIKGVKSTAVSCTKESVPAEKHAGKHHNSATRITKRKETAVQDKIQISCTG